MKEAHHTVWVNETETFRACPLYNRVGVGVLRF